MSGDRHPRPALIRRARPDEAGELRALAHRSKAHWPYSAEFLLRVRPLLRLEPHLIRTGRGRTLFEHAAQVARSHGAQVLDWDAEPYAEGFYRAMGGREIGRTQSAAEEGRTLPRMRLDLSRDA